MGRERKKGAERKLARLEVRADKAGAVQGGAVPIRRPATLQPSTPGKKSFMDYIDDDCMSN